MLREQENYDNGVMHGEYQVWDYKGKLVEKEITIGRENW